VRVDFIGKLETQKLKDYITLFVNKSLSCYTMEALIRNFSRAFHDFHLSKQEQIFERRDQIDLLRENMKTLWNRYATSLDLIQEHIRSQMPDQVFQSYRAPRLAFTNTHKMTYKIIALLLASLKKINDSEDARRGGSVDLFSECSCLLKVKFVDLGTGQQVRKVLFKLPCLLEEPDARKQRFEASACKKRLKRVLAQVSAEIERDDLMHQNTQIDYQIVLTTQSLFSDSVFEGAVMSEEWPKNIKFINLDASDQRGSQSLSSKKTRDADFLKSFPSFTASNKLEVAA